MPGRSFQMLIGWSSRVLHSSSHIIPLQMPSRPPDVTPQIVQRDLTEEQLQAYLASSELAVDTETLGLQHLRDRLCCVQLCDRAGRATLVQIPRDQVVGPTPLEARAPRLKRLL